MSGLRHIFVESGGRDHQKLNLRELATLLNQICTLSLIEVEAWYEPEAKNQAAIARWRIQQEEAKLEEVRRARLRQGRLVEDQIMQDGTEWEPHYSNDSYEVEQDEGDVHRDEPSERQAQSASASSSGRGGRDGWRRTPSFIQTKRSPVNQEEGMEVNGRLKTEKNRTLAAQQLGLLIEDVTFTIAKQCDAARFIRRNQNKEDAVQIMIERLDTLTSILETLSQAGYSDASVVAWMLNSCEAVFVWLNESGDVSGDRFQAVADATRMMHSCVSMSISPRSSWLIAVEALTLPALNLTTEDVILPEGYDAMICMLCSSMGALKHRPSQSYLRSLCEASGQCIMQGNLSLGEVASLVRGLVDLGCRVPQTVSLKWLQSLESSTSALLMENSSTAEDIVNLLDAIASLTSPSSSSLQSLTSLLDVVMLQEDGGDEYEDDYFSDPIQPDQGPIGSTGTPYTPGAVWLDALYSAVQQCTFSVTQQIALVSSLNSLRCRPNGQWLDEMLVKSRRRLAAADAQQLADLIGSLTSLRFKASEGWLQFWLSEVFHKLPYASPSQCCLMLRCLARLNHRPPRLWMEELSSQLQGRLHQFNASQLSDMAVATVQLGLKPTEPFLQEFERVCDGSMIEKCSGAELTGLAWALAQMSWRPQVSWTYSFVLSAYKRLDSFNSQQLGVLFEALPKISPQLTSLDELVQIVATENHKRG